MGAYLCHRAVSLCAAVACNSEMKVVDVGETGGDVVRWWPADHLFLFVSGMTRLMTDQLGCRANAVSVVPVRYWLTITIYSRTGRMRATM